MTLPDAGTDYRSQLGPNLSVIAARTNCWLCDVDLFHPGLIVSIRVLDSINFGKWYRVSGAGAYGDQ